MKRKFVFLLAIVLFISCIALLGCSNSSNVGSDSNDSILDIHLNSLSASDLSIEDFKWETVPAKYNGKNCYAFSLTNNSDYDIIAVEFTYKVKDDVTDSALSVYDEFMNEHEDYIEKTDSPRDVILRGSKDVLVVKGEKLTDLFFTVGFQRWAWYDFPTKEQFELMEPKEMQLGVVGEDNTLYIAYYDFVNKIWMLDNKTVPADTWSDSEIAQQISRPIEGHHIVITDEQDEFEVCSYGVTLDAYNQYVEELKKAGFNEKSSTSSGFEGRNAEGYSVDIWYYDDNEKLDISIEKAS